MRCAPPIEWIPFAGWAGGSIGAPFALLLLVHTATALVLAHSILFHEARVDFRRVLLAIGAVLLALIVELRVLRAAGLWISNFAVLNFVWHDLVYVAPSCAVRALVRRRRGAEVSRAALGCAFLALAFLPVAAWAHLVEPYRLMVERTAVPIEARRAGSAAITVAILADLQTDRAGAHERAAIDAILERAPDVVLLPGDLFQGTRALLERECDAIRAELARLDAPGGVWFVQGDVDTDDSTAALLAGTRIQSLFDRAVHVRVRDREVTIAGLADARTSRRTAEFVREVESARGDDDIRIVFSHHPDPILLLSPNSRVDLFVAGHTHGGQVVIPGFGPPITLTGLPRTIAAGGLHDLDGRRIFVSRGVGMERSQAPRIRLFCRPEVSFLELGDAPSRLAAGGSR